MQKRLTAYTASAALLLMCAVSAFTAAIPSTAAVAAEKASIPVPSLYEKRSFSVTPKGRTETLAAQQSRRALSKYSPTGIYAAPNEKITIDLQGAYADAYIHDYKTTTYRNFLRDVYKIPQGKTTISSPRGGMIYLSNENETGVAQVQITGGTHVPVFEKGNHTKTNWNAMLTKYPNAPYVELVGEHFFVTAFMASAKKYTNDPSALLPNIDKAIEVEHRLAGYDAKNSTTVHRADPHYQHMMELPNPSEYYMYASDYHTAYSFEGI